MSIVKRDRLKQVYEDKVRQYKEPTRLIKEKEGLKYSKTIPIIITLERIIHKQSAEALE